MNWKTWFPLVLAVVLGVVAAKAAHDWVLKNKAASAPTTNMVKIVVAKADVQAGHEITADDLTFAQMDAANSPGSAFKTTEEVVGRSAEAFTVKGQPIIESMLAPKGAGTGLQALVPPGMRAITMEVNEFSGVAGLLAPGCRVDILATVQGGGDNGQITKTVVQNVKVTAVGQRTSAAAGDQPPPTANEMFRSVTVLAKLEEAEAIELACSTSRPRLVLRGGRDNEIVATAGISLAELRGGKDNRQDIASTPTTQPAFAVAPATQPVAVAIAKEPPHRTVKVIRGGQETIVTLSVLDGVPADAIGGTDNEPSDPKDSTDNKDPFETK